MFEESDPQGNLLRSRRIPLTTRYSFRFELQLLLEKAGFAIEALFGGYDRRPYDAAGEIIFVARRQRWMFHHRRREMRNLPVQQAPVSLMNHSLLPY